MVRLAVALLVPMSLAGCASRMYVDPPGKTFALEFVNRAPQVLMSYSVYEDDYDCYDPRPVAAFQKLAGKTIRAKARPHYTVAYGYNEYGGLMTGPALRCGGTATFDVEPGAYRVITGFDSTKKACIFQIERQGGSGWSPARNMRLRTQSQPFGSAGPWCKPDEAYRGSSSLPVPRGR